MGYLKETVRYKNLLNVIKIVLTLSLGQSAVGRGFSLNDKMLVENMRAESLVAQRSVNDFMLANGYKPYNVPFTKELMDNVGDSNMRYKISVKERKEAKKKNEKYEKLDDLNTELKSLNDKKNDL